MYPNYKIILDLRRPKTSGLFPVKVRVTLNRVQKYYPIGLDLSEKDFGRVQNSSVRKELRLLKNKITNWDKKVKDIIHQLDPFTFDDFKEKLFEKKIESPDLYGLFDLTIEDLTIQGRMSTAQVYRDSRNSLKRFRSRLKVKEVTTDFLKKYESYMISNGKSVTTIGIYLRHLRSIYNKAIDAEIIDRKYYPFGKNKYQIKAPRNIKKALTLDQIKGIVDYEVIEGSSQHLARDIWLFSYYCNGMNIKDILNLKFKNIQKDVIQFERCVLYNNFIIWCPKFGNELNIKQLD